MENLSYFVVVDKNSNRVYPLSMVEFYHDYVNVYDPDAYSGEGGWKNLKIDDIDIEMRKHSVDSIMKAEEIENSLNKEVEEREKGLKLLRKLWALSSILRSRLCK